MDSEVELIHRELVRVARSQRTTFYSDIAPLVGLDMGSPADRNRIAGILDEVSRREYDEGRRLLSSVVVLKERNIPGDGFFKLAKDLKLHDGTDDLAFWAGEVNRVHRYWSAQA